MFWFIVGVCVTRLFIRDVDYSHIAFVVFAFVFVANFRRNSAHCVQLDY